MKRAAPFVAIAFVLGLFAVLNLTRQGGQAAAADAIDASLPQLDGQPLELSAFRGKIVVVNFFASWCAPCWGELPYFERASRDYADRGVAVVGIAVRSPGVEVRDMIDKIGMSFPVALDDTGSVATGVFGLRGMPGTFFLDRQGRLVDVVQGPIKEADLRRRVEALL